MIKYSGRSEVSSSPWGRSVTGNNAGKRKHRMSRRVRAGGSCSGECREKGKRRQRLGYKTRSYVLNNNNELI